ncbi:MAG: hypothetical protein JXR97_09170, partial [Planctomycetes bacterium]|nr:hypothetical protein [Planctomycetota bacterium]
MSDQGGGPKAGFFVVLFLVVAGRVAFGLRDSTFPENEGGGNNVTITLPNANTSKDAVEAPDANVVTTVKEYNYVPSQKLAAVKGVSGYEPMQNRTVKFALNVWAGWAPIILKNNGKNPGAVWKTPGGEEFKVELVLIDDP